MSALNLDAIEQRCQAATPGPWVVMKGKPSETITAQLEVNEVGGCTWERGARCMTIRIDASDYDANERSSRSWAKKDLSFVAHARQDIPELIARIRELEAQEARVRAVHRPLTIYDDCDHDHNLEDAGVIEVDSIGLVCSDGKMYDICISCCSDDGESQSEHCVGHDHGLVNPICATIAALDEASA